VSAGAFGEAACAALAPPVHQPLLWLARPLSKAQGFGLDFLAITILAAGGTDRAAGFGIRGRGGRAVTITGGLVGITLNWARLSRNPRR
jgi:hypothetical protein